MVVGPQAWPKCTQCGGRRFECRPFASEDTIICLACGYVSKNADGEREPVNQADEFENASSDKFIPIK